MVPKLHPQENKNPNPKQISPSNVSLNFKASPWGDTELTQNKNYGNPSKIFFKAHPRKKLPTPRKTDSLIGAVT